MNSHRAPDSPPQNMKLVLVERLSYVDQYMLTQSGHSPRILINATL